MRAFVTGATGFAGSHLLDLLLANGLDVFGLVHEETSHQETPDHARVHPVVGSILDASLLKQVAKDVRPDLVFHLAGQASPSRSWSEPALTFEINTIGTINMLEAALAAGRPRVVVVTSAHLYGRIPPESLPVTEATAVTPEHPYGVSKMAAAQLALLYWRRYGLPTVEARPFNHVGPRQAPGFVVPDFAGQLAAIRLGRQEPSLNVGNLQAERDFTDVRDVVRAYWLLAQHGRAGETYLICTGQPVRIATLLATLIDIAGVTVEVEVDESRIQPLDTPRIYGSSSRLTQDTGWLPEVSLRQSLADAYQEWLDRLSS
jgi:GDP-4-dehydro-6-deoxy-D-mannose reductase